MKKVFLLFLSVFFVSLTAEAVRKKSKYKGVDVSTRAYGTAGCGLGATVVGNGDGINQSSAATTNASSGAQIFGITSGTSECVPDEDGSLVKASLDRWAPLFLEVNGTKFKEEVARGRGESIDAFAAALGCLSTGPMARELQRSYDKLFSSDDATRTSSLVLSTLSQKRGLKAVCPRLEEV